MSVVLNAIDAFSADEVLDRARVRIGLDTRLEPDEFDVDEYSLLRTERDSWERLN